jgi:hypothetical protein
MRTILACVVAVATTAAATAAPITTLYNTGVNGSGGLLADGAVDSHYSIVGWGGQAFAIGNAGSFWAAGNTATAQWISPTRDTFGGTGPFTYTTTFDLTGFDPASASVTGRWAADNEAQMFLNGVLVNATPGFQFAPWQYFTPFAINSGFIPGVNTLTFVVPNSRNGEDADGRTGLIVEMSGTADVAQITPEPVSLVVFGGLVLGGAGVALRRRMAKA